MVVAAPKPEEGTTLNETLGEILGAPYQAVLKELQGQHKVLLQAEKQGFSDAMADNPTLVEESMSTLRLHVSRLYRPLNTLYQLLNNKLQYHAHKRQLLYEEALSNGKSESAAMNHAKEMCRVDKAEVAVIKNKISEVKNEISRYDDIVTMLQSRQKAFNAERMNP